MALLQPDLNFGTSWATMQISSCGCLYLEPEARRRLFQPTVEAPPGLPPPPPLPVERDRRFGRRQRDGGDRFRFGGNVVVRADEVVDGDVVALGGSVTVDGRVRGDAVAIGGSLQLGPNADVSGDAVTIGGTLTRDPAARVGGKVVDVGAGNFDFSRMRWDRFPFGRVLTFAPFFGAAAGLIAFMSTLARVVVLCVLTSLVLLVGRGYVERVGARAIAEPVKAGAIGLLAQLLFIPLLFVTVLLLVVTIIGIPLLVLVPFAILALAVVGLVGFTAVMYDLGRYASERLSWNIDNPYLIAVTGIVVLLSPVLIARLLGLAEWMLFPITGALAFCGFLIEVLGLDGRIWRGGAAAVCAAWRWFDTCIDASAGCVTETPRSRFNDFVWRGPSRLRSHRKASELRRGLAVARSAEADRPADAGLKPRATLLESSLLSQPVGDQFGREVRSTNRDDDVLLAVQHVGHRRSGLRRRHEHGADFLAVSPCRTRAASRRADDPASW